MVGVRSVLPGPHQRNAAITGPALGRGGPVVLDGVGQLKEVLGLAGLTVVEAVARYTVFLHPATVAQTGGQALFPVIRNVAMHLRGTFAMGDDGREVLLDDNTSPTLSFLWAGGLRKGPDVQFNHVWNVSRDRGAYTALWNLCATPAFLAKTTDGANHPEVVAALRYRAYSLYGTTPANVPVPEEPEAFSSLIWAPHPPPVPNLEDVLRARLRRNPRSRPAIAARAIGWCFSDWRPDPSV
jgi:hypothetical protein